MDYILWLLAARMWTHHSSAAFDFATLLLVLMVAVAWFWWLAVVDATRVVRQWWRA
jgi:hypothetical protein